MTVQEQWEQYIEGLRTRKRNPVAPTTLDRYTCYWGKWIGPNLGSRKVCSVENKAMRDFVAVLAKATLAPTTIRAITTVLKDLLSSAVDKNGNELYPRKWNADFIDMPVVEKRSMKAPSIGSDALETALERTQSPRMALYALIAGTGLRIAEALGIRVGKDDGKGSFWLPADSKIIIRDQYHGRYGHTPTKTPAGCREVDLAPELNTFLQKHASAEGYLFGGKEPWAISTLERKVKEDGIPGFHSLRRFRLTHLENQNTPRSLAYFWTGHADESTHDSYIKLEKEYAARKEWVVKVGLGFRLPEKIDADI